MEKKIAALGALAALRNPPGIPARRHHERNLQTKACEAQLKIRIERYWRRGSLEEP